METICHMIISLGKIFFKNLVLKTVGLHEGKPFVQVGVYDGEIIIISRTF
jgi:hypothetical protein